MLELAIRGLSVQQIADTILSERLSCQYWHTDQLQQRFILTLGYGSPELERMCSSCKRLDRIDNRRHLNHEESGTR